MPTNDWLRIIFAIITGLPSGFSISMVVTQMEWNQPVSLPLITTAVFFFLVIVWFWYTEREKSTIESELIGSAIMYTYITNMFIGSIMFSVLVSRSAKVGEIVGSGFGALLFFILGSAIISRIYEKQNS